MDTLHEQLLTLPHPPLSPLTPDGLKDIDEAFLSLHLVLDQIHDRLSQHLPYLPPPPKVRRPLSNMKFPLTTQSLSRLLSRATDAASLGVEEVG